VSLFVGTDMSILFFVSRPNHAVKEEDQVGDERKSLLTAIKEVRSHNNSPAYEIADSRNRL
jgi:hypothetical protein